MGGKDALSRRLTQIFILPRKELLLLSLPLLAKDSSVENQIGVTGQGSVCIDDLLQLYGRQRKGSTAAYTMNILSMI
jgi:hypothetical protein